MCMRERMSVRDCVRASVVVRTILMQCCHPLHNTYGEGVPAYVWGCKGE